jgi:hypothetical protein
LVWGYTDRESAARDVAQNYVRKLMIPHTKSATSKLLELLQETVDEFDLKCISLIKNKIMPLCGSANNDFNKEEYQTYESVLMELYGQRNNAFKDFVQNNLSEVISKESFDELMWMIHESDLELSKFSNTRSVKIIFHDLRQMIGIVSDNGIYDPSSLFRYGTNENFQDSYFVQAKAKVESLINSLGVPEFHFTANIALQAFDRSR